MSPRGRFGLVSTDIAAVLCATRVLTALGVTGSLPVPAGHRRPVANCRSHDLYKPAAIVEESLNLSRARRSIAKRAPGRDTAMMAGRRASLMRAPVAGPSDFYLVSATGGSFAGSTPASAKSWSASSR